MDNRPIGVFDSGVGGLTTVKELHAILPNEDIVYFGDTGRVPYGTRSAQTIRKYAAQDVRYLVEHDVKMVVAACGTVSANVREEDIRGWNLKVPYTGVVPHTARAACETGGMRIGVIATPASIRSGAYPKAIAEIDPSVQVFQSACPLFVPLVENGMTGVNNQITRLTAQMYMEPLLRENIDTLILGCTHYPLLAPVLSNLLGGGVKLVDAGAAAARYLRALLLETNTCTGRKEPGRTSYFVTDTVRSFAQVAQNFLDEDISEHTTFVDLDSGFWQ